jgi:hypothetical protein
MRRFSIGLLLVLLVATTACLGSPGSPPAMSAIDQGDGAATEINADSWCVGGVSADKCASAEGPVPEVVVRCDDNLALAPPGDFTLLQSDQIEPVTGDEAWLVIVEEGTVVVRAESSGKWSDASWTFELRRDHGAC